MFTVKLSLLEQSKLQKSGRHTVAMDGGQDWLTNEVYAGVLNRHLEILLKGGRYTEVTMLYYC